MSAEEIRWTGPNRSCDGPGMSSVIELSESFGSFESFESFDGTAISWRQLGSGAPVVMVHGSGGGLHSWQPVAEELHDRFELWMPARRGYAPSGPGRSPKRFTDEVGDLEALIDKIGRPVHLVGMSYGATVALHAAAAGLPVRSLVLWEPPLYAAGAELNTVLAEFEDLTAHGDRRRADRQSERCVPWASRAVRARGWGPVPRFRQTRSRSGRLGWEPRPRTYGRSPPAWARPPSTSPHKGW